MPAFVAVPSVGGDSAGYLGVEYGPLETGAAPQPGQPVKIRGLTLNGVTLEEIDRRQNLVKRYDTAFGGLAQEDRAAGRHGRVRPEGLRHDALRQGPRGLRPVQGIAEHHRPVRQGRLLPKLPARHPPGRVRRQVRHPLARRLGHPLRQLQRPEEQASCPTSTPAWPACSSALDAKGLLASTSVFVTGEFGRTPKINKNAGRDHYPRSMFCLLGGGGIKGGQVVGESDAKAEAPKDKPITPDDVAATFYKSLGIDPAKEYRTPGGRPVMIVRYGTPIPELLA